MPELLTKRLFRLARDETIVINQAEAARAPANRIDDAETEYENQLVSNTPEIALYLF